MVLQCGASLAALPEHEEMIFTASVEVSGVSLVGSRLLRAAVAHSRGRCGRFFHRMAQYLSRAIMRLNSAVFALVSPCPHLILSRHGKIKSVRRCFVPHGSTLSSEPTKTKFAPFRCVSAPFIEQRRRRGFGYD